MSGIREQSLPKCDELRGLCFIQAFIRLSILRVYFLITIFDNVGDERCRSKSTVRTETFRCHSLPVKLIWRSHLIVKFVRPFFSCDVLTIVRPVFDATQYKINIWWYPVSSTACSCTTLLLRTVTCSQVV